jgi:hypothetical protein
VIPELLHAVDGPEVALLSILSHTVNSNDHRADDTHHDTQKRTSVSRPFARWISMLTTDRNDAFALFNFPLSLSRFFFRSASVPSLSASAVLMASKIPFTALFVAG